MTSTGLIAIVRGLDPRASVEIGEALYRAGFRTIEVPLNSPDPLVSIARLREHLPADCRVGAGTVLRVQDVLDVAAAGGEVIVSPNVDAEVIRQSVALGMASYPGAATPTEALQALGAGATAVKLFPAETIGIAGLRAWRAVMPRDARLVPVGGVGVDDLADWVAAGADGAGLGGSLYRPGDAATVVARRAVAFVDAWHAAVGEVTA